jgi:hypothetical protein
MSQVKAVAVSDTGRDSEMAARQLRDRSREAWNDTTPIPGRQVRSTAVGDT